MKTEMSKSYYTELGVIINSRRFSIKIPKLKIQALSVLSKKKSRKSHDSKPIDPDDWLKEVNTRYNDYLSVKKESKILSSGASASQYSISSEDLEKDDFDEQPATIFDAVKVENEDNEISELSISDHDYENYQMFSTTLSFKLHPYSEDRKVIVLKDLSGVKIYEDIFPEVDDEKLRNFLEESLATTVTVYEEIGEGEFAPDYENIGLNLFDFSSLVS